MMALMDPDTAIAGIYAAAQGRRAWSSALAGNLVHVRDTLAELEMARGPALNAMIVGECFGLTPAEARVAVHIANGKTVQAIARLHGATVATVRSQLGKAMEKVGVQRQAQLAQVLLALPVRE